MAQSPTKTNSVSNSFQHPEKNLGSLESGQSSSGSGFQLSVSAIIFIGLLVVIGVFVIIAVLLSSIHRVEEGNVALYFQNGALQREFSGPGVHSAAPFVTRIL